MPKLKSPSSQSQKKPFVLGTAKFAKISAVEGIGLTPAMKKRAAEAKRKGLSADEYRRAITRSYRKG